MKLDDKILVADIMLMNPEQRYNHIVSALAVWKSKPGDKIVTEQYKQIVNAHISVYKQLTKQSLRM